MKLLLVLTAALAVATGAFAGTHTYGWEDGVGTVMGSYGNLANEANVTDFVYAGAHALYMQESPLGGTPQAYVAFIENCQHGDVIDASFFGFDDTPGASPSFRIWGHYALTGDINAYEGSAAGNETYSEGTGWESTSWSWLFDSDLDTRDALVVEYRLYSNAEFQEYWADNVEVTAPDHCTVTFAGEGTTGTDETSWGKVKSLFR